jgi:hypothetical protein
MSHTREEWEGQLNDFDPQRRKEALLALRDLVEQGAIDLPEPRRAVNLHCHTFFSFNGYGYSPSCYAWKARREGLAVAGIVDFDVLDGVDEFLEACRLVGIRGCAGLETRVYLPQFSTRETNSPGEPGITYHMGFGYTATQVENPGVLPQLKETAQARNRGILERVNPFLAPVTLSYEDDVLPLAPNGNPTERHLCMAYDAKGQQMIPDEDERAEFWTGKLGSTPEEMKELFKSAPAFQGLIRAKTMKAGGVGYVKPEGPDFPALDDVNAFTLNADGIPVFAWLNGLTDGEQAIDELIGLMVAGGAAAMNIIPDRSWNIKDPEKKKLSLAKLHEIVEIGQARGFPLIAGTEMNAYGQRFVDDFEAPEMAPVVQPALDGAHVMYAHTLLQSVHGMGYLSDWAKQRFEDAKEKNVFFAKVGYAVEPQESEALNKVSSTMTPAEVLGALGI